jgi:hypothetical protein
MKNHKTFLAIATFILVAVMLPESASAQRKQDGRPTLLPCPAGTCGLNGDKNAVDLQHCSAKNCQPASAPTKLK